MLTWTILCGYQDCWGLNRLLIFLKIWVLSSLLQLMFKCCPFCWVGILTYFTPHDIILSWGTYYDALRAYSRTRSVLLSMTPASTSMSASTVQVWPRRKLRTLLQTRILRPRRSGPVLLSCVFEALLIITVENSHREPLRTHAQGLLVCNRVFQDLLQTD
ncbi:hypothetical protein BDN72DRAFT_505107 [Pluteus cervinus]|uniref:Uncharacterized protein n=1 Tax=Pluteus cervinus TaxID=181527 RepID=A0ACD3AYM0_9AGAR|nr:hypothetical protein BDN72DRAFT_505107 [Pluteus cervinus]